MYIFAPYNLIMCCMVKKWIFPLLIGVCLINTSMAQENPILLFPKGAPGETIKLIEKLIRTVEKPVVRVFCVLRM